MHKKYLTLGILLITMGLLLMSHAVVRAQANEFTVPLSDPDKRGKLRAHLNYGSITVKGTARKDVLVKYASVKDEDKNRMNIDVKIGNRNNNSNDNTNEDSESRAGLRRIGGGGMDLQVTQNNNRVEVMSDSWNNKLNLEIEIPSGMDLELHTYNGGDLMVTNVQGEVALTNYNGEITALNISGSAVASTYNGDIKVTFDKVTENAPMSYSTYNGDIELSFPASIKANLKMQTEQGDILTDFDVNILSSGPVQMKDTKGGVYKVVVDEWKHGTLNGGGPEITMKNYNGDIVIRKK